MSVTITVEDGSVVTNANSYVTVVELLTYAEERGHPMCVTVDEAGSLLIRAQEWIRDSYGHNFQGNRVGSTQELDFPRDGVTLDGFSVDNDEIPRNLTYAQMARAIEIEHPELFTTEAPSIKREKLDGVFEIEYSNSGNVLPVSAFAKADTLLRPMLKAGGVFSVRS